MRKLAWGKGQGAFWGSVSWEAKRAIIVKSLMYNRDILEESMAYIRKYFKLWGWAVRRDMLKYF